MSALETVEKMLGALEAGDLRKASTFLSEEFIVTGIIPEAMNRNEFLGFMKGLSDALSEFSFNVTDVHEDADLVRMNTHIRGIQNGRLNLSAVGIPPLRATGLEIILPEEPMEFTVRNNRVASARISPVPGGGLMGLLEQLGVDLATRTGV